jgi:hypothetical protein
MMRYEIAPIYHGVSHGFVRIIDADLRTQTPAHALPCPLLHLGEALQIILYGIIAVRGCDAFASFLTHLSLLSVISVGFTTLDKFNCKFVKLIKVVGGMRDLISVDLQKCQVL